jgi:hypothetical protein
MTRQFAYFAIALSFSVVVGAVGCGKSPDSPPKQATDSHGHHDHGDEGPHHGHIIELGEEEFHAELVHDDAGGKVTIYLLDSKAKNPAAADTDEIVVSVAVDGQPKDFTLKATDATKRDQFESKEPDLVSNIDHEKDAKGRLRVKIGNKDFVGIIDHHGHSHEK